MEYTFSYRMETTQGKTDWTRSLRRTPDRDEAAKWAATWVEVCLENGADAVEVKLVEIPK